MSYKLKLGRYFFYLALGILYYPFLDSAQAQSPYPHFDQWPLVKLEGGKLLCTDYQNVFMDDFKDKEKFESQWDTHMWNNPVDGAWHCSAEAIFRPENVRINEAAGLLELEVRKEDFTLNVPPLSNVPCYPDGTTEITKHFTSGVVNIKHDLAFNLGRYEIKCQLPNKNNIWSAFWMWHHDEIDMFDIAFRSGVIHNVYNSPYTASIQQSPCCPKMIDCSFCPTHPGIDCSASSNCNQCPNWDCEYLADGFHTYICEWTPYRISFSVDGITVGVVSRYYYPDKTPVVIECGDDLPEAVVRENPAFIQIIGRFFRPILWVVPECDGAPGCTTEADLPAVLKADYVRIDEKVYQHAYLESDCYKLCQDQKVCMNLKVDLINGLVNPPNVVPPAPDVIRWEVKTNNADFVEKDKVRACLTPNCQGACIEDVEVHAFIGEDAFVKKVLHPIAEPEFFSSCESDHTLIDRTEPGAGDGPKCLCVDLKDNCATITKNGALVGTEENGGFQCFTADNLCNEIVVTYEDCEGNYVSKTATDIWEGSSATDAYFNWNQKVAHLNYITEPQINFCYLAGGNNVSIQSVTVNAFGLAAPTVSHTQTCVHIGNVGHYTEVTVRLMLCGAHTVEKKYIFIYKKGFYELKPNPTDGTAVLEVTAPIEFVTDEGEQVKIEAKAERADLVTSNGILVASYNLSAEQSTYPINLTAWPSGQYKLLIYDEQLTGSAITIPIVKL